MTTQPPEPPLDPPPDLPELESEVDESEMRRELLNDVSACHFKRERGGKAVRGDGTEVRLKEGKALGRE
jgi:hypothetical protein